MCEHIHTYKYVRTYVHKKVYNMQGSFTAVSEPWKSFFLNAAIYFFSFFPFWLDLFLHLARRNIFGL